jgi:hypothetical protein
MARAELGTRGTSRWDEPRLDAHAGVRAAQTGEVPEVQAALETDIDPETLTVMASLEADFAAIDDNIARARRASPSGTSSETWSGPSANGRRMDRRSVHLVIISGRLLRTLPSSLKNRPASAALSLCSTSWSCPTRCQRRRGRGDAVPPFPGLAGRR